MPLIAAALPPVRASACQDCTPCGIAYNEASSFNPQGEWQPGVNHASPAHSCSDVDGIGGCADQHDSCDDQQHDGGGVAATVADLVAADPSELAMMVANDPALALTADGMAVQLRDPCVEGAIAVHLPLARVAQ